MLSAIASSSKATRLIIEELRFFARMCADRLGDSPVPGIAESNRLRAQPSLACGQ
jgi:hypothetical protein